MIRVETGLKLGQYPAFEDRYCVIAKLEASDSRTRVTAKWMKRVLPA
jgi:hypothetical protein